MSKTTPGTIAQAIRAAIDHLAENSEVSAITWDNWDQRNEAFWATLSKTTNYSQEAQNTIEAALKAAFEGVPPIYQIDATNVYWATVYDNSFPGSEGVRKNARQRTREATASLRGKLRASIADTHAALTA